MSEVSKELGSSRASGDREGPQPREQKLSAPLERQDLHDLVWEALDNSMGPDWTITLGTTYVIDALAEAGVI